MTYTCFDVTIEGKIAHIVMKRPEKRNSMIAKFWTELPEIIRDIDDNAKARVIVLSSTGPVFCAGIDLSMFAEGFADNAAQEQASYPASFYQNVTAMQDMGNAIETCRLPVIAAVQGPAIGGGVDLITACDIRLATQDAAISIYEIVIGMTADVGTFPRIQNLLPEGIVKELAFTGRRMPADEMLRLGFVNRVYENQAEMLGGAMELARIIAARPPLAVYGSKRIIHYGRDHSTQDTLDNIAVWNMSMLIPQELMEGMQAKMQKTKPNFAELPKREKLD